MRLTAHHTFGLFLLFIMVFNGNNTINTEHWIQNNKGNQRESKKKIKLLFFCLMVKIITLYTLILTRKSKHCTIHAFITNYPNKSYRERECRLIPLRFEMRKFQFIISLPANWLTSRKETVKEASNKYLNGWNVWHNLYISLKMKWKRNYRQRTKINLFLLKYLHVFCLPLPNCLVFFCFVSILLSFFCCFHYEIVALKP